MLARSIFWNCNCVNFLVFPSLYDKGRPLSTGSCRKAESFMKGSQSRRSSRFFFGARSKTLKGGYWKIFYIYRTFLTESNNPRSLETCSQGGGSTFFSVPPTSPRALLFSPGSPEAGRAKPVLDPKASEKRDRQSKPPFHTLPWLG